MEDLSLSLFFYHTTGI